MPNPETRAAGYRFTGAFLAVVSLLGLPPALWTPAVDIGLGFTASERAELCTSTVVGLAAAWALWTRRRAAPEFFLAWAMVVLTVSLHLSLGFVPRILFVINDLLPGTGLPTTFRMSAVVANLLLNTALLGLGYWQLTKQRPPA